MASALRMWFWGKRKEKDAVTDETLMTNSLSSGRGFGLREHETVKFRAVKGPKAVAAPKKIQKKQQRREDCAVDREHDFVLVPSGGVCLNGSDSDDFDWSIGWLEPHASSFLSNDEADDSFAVLVPCYRNIQQGLIMEARKNPILPDYNGFMEPTKKQFYS